MKNKPEEPEGDDWDSSENDSDFERRARTARVKTALDYLVAEGVVEKTTVDGEELYSLTPEGRAMGSLGQALEDKISLLLINPET